ncbi:unnamed protein product [Chironomus riparius]|uniref:Ionotropic receptor n=1 Tax=Chironomus riparius TaxID=315576 RepID=A0A9N9WY29_9DIPT|nr:unnamed protein product [Chironomus riparius]
MHSIKCLLVFVSITSTFCEKSAIKPENDDIEVVSTAIAEVCVEFFIKKSINFDIVLYSDVDRHLSDIIDSLVKKITRNYSINLLKIKNVTLWDHLVLKSTVVLLKDSIDFEIFQNRVKSPRHNNQESTIVIYVDQTQQEPEISFESNQSFYMTNFFFLLNQELTLNLESIIFFSPTLCGSTQTQLGNSFNKSTAQWTYVLKFHHKFENLYKCPLGFAHFFSKYLYFKDEHKFMLQHASNRAEKVEIIKFLSSTENFYGFSVDMAEIMSKIMNFTPFYHRYEVSYEDLDLRTIDTISDDFYNEDYETRFTNYPADFSLVLITNKLDFNKSGFFLNPFNFHTWIAVLTSLFVACIVIFYMNLRLGIVRIRPRKDLTRPVLNVLQIVFGCPQKKLPSANFGRFFVISFIGLCLLLRICYWSQLVRFMALGVNKQELKTVEDLIDKNYTIYSCHRKSLRKKIRLPNFKINQLCQNSVEFACETLENADTNIGFIIIKETIQTYIDTCEELFTLQEHFEINLDMTVFLMSSKSISYDTFNEVLRKLTPAGIPQYLLAYHTSALYGTDRKIEEKESGKSSFDDMNKFLLVFLCITSLFCEKIEIESEVEDIDVVSTAIAEVCVEFFIKKSINFDIILYGHVDSHLSDILDGLVNKLVQNNSTNLRKIENVTFWDHLVLKSSVVLLKDSIDFGNFLNRVKSPKHNNKESTIVIYVDQAQQEPKIIFEPNRIFFMANFFFLLNRELTLTLSSFTFFSPALCGKTQARFDNSFNKSIAQWAHKLQAYHKFKNLHKCPLGFGHVFSKYLYFKDEYKQTLHANDKLLLRKFLSKSEKYYGFLVDMAEIMSKVMNFTPFYHRFEFGDHDFHIDTISDDFLGEVYQNWFTNYQTGFSAVLITNKLNFDYSGFLLDPFNFHTWMAVLTSLFVACIVIFYMNLRQNVNIIESCENSIKFTCQAPELEESSVKEPKIQESSVKAPEIQESSVKGPKTQESSVKRPKIQESSVKAPEI